LIETKDNQFDQVKEAKRFKALFSQIRKAKGQICLEIDIDKATGNRTAKSEYEIEKGDEVLCVPQDLWMTIDYAETNPFGK
jgi:hypothetical protein